jgi:hypothetical protein
MIPTGLLLNEVESCIHKGGRVVRNEAVFVSNVTLRTPLLLHSHNSFYYVALVPTLVAGGDCRISAN